MSCTSQDSTYGNEINRSDSMSSRNSPWTEDENKKFIEGLEHYGKDWPKIAEYVGTRNRALIAAKAIQMKTKLKMGRFEDFTD